MDTFRLLEEVFRWPRLIRPTRRNTSARGSRSSPRAGRLRSRPEHSSAPLRRFATGCVRPVGTKAVVRTVDAHPFQSLFRGFFMSDSGAFFGGCSTFIPARPCSSHHSPLEGESQKPSRARRRQMRWGVFNPSYTLDVFPAISPRISRPIAFVFGPLHRRPRRPPRVRHGSSPPDGLGYHAARTETHHQKQDQSHQYRPHVGRRSDQMGPNRIIGRHPRSQDLDRP